MATSHYCGGTWRDGPLSACPKHKRLDRKAPSVYRDGGSGGESSGGDSSGDKSGD